MPKPKQVINLTTLEIYKSGNYAAETLKCSPSAISRGVSEGFKVKGCRLELLKYFESLHYKDKEKLLSRRWNVYFY